MMEHDGDPTHPYREEGKQNDPQNQYTGKTLTPSRPSQTDTVMTMVPPPSPNKA
jgi:hypothetical protein